MDPWTCVRDPGSRSDCVEYPAFAPEGMIRRSDRAIHRCGGKRGDASLDDAGVWMDLPRPLPAMLTFTEN